MVQKSFGKNHKWLLIFFSTLCSPYRTNNEKMCRDILQLGWFRYIGAGFEFPWGQWLAFSNIPTSCFLGISCLIWCLTLPFFIFNHLFLVVHVPLLMHFNFLKYIFLKTANRPPMSDLSKSNPNKSLTKVCLAFNKTDI